VPSANLVISYNHMKDAVELCQRQGRARQKRAAFVIMEQRVDRPLSKLLRVQRHQESVIRNFVPGHNNFQIEECRRREQRERETNILRRLLCDSRSKSDVRCNP
jgi:ERCC4-related helicase